MTLSFGLGQGFEIVFLTVKVISDLKPEVELIFKESKGEIIGTGSRKCGTSKVFFCRTPKRQNYIEHRSDDGIHWNAKAHRWLTNIILTHIAIEWGLGLPTFIHGKNEKKTFQVQMVDTNGDDRSVDTNISKDQV